MGSSSSSSSSSGTVVVGNAHTRLTRHILRAILRRLAPPLQVAAPLPPDDLVGVVLQYLGNQSPAFRSVLLVADRLARDAVPSVALHHPTLRLSEAAVWQPALYTVVEHGHGHHVTALTLQIDAVPLPFDDDVLRQLDRLDHDDDELESSVLHHLPHLHDVTVLGPRREDRRTGHDYRREWSWALDTIAQVRDLRKLHLRRCELSECDRQRVVRVLEHCGHGLTDLEMEFRADFSVRFDPFPDFLDRVLGELCPALRSLRLVFPERRDTVFQQLQRVGPWGLACARSLQTLSVECGHMDLATWRRLVAPCAALRQLHLRFVWPAAYQFVDDPPDPFPCACANVIERLVVTLTDSIWYFATQSQDEVNRTVLACLPSTVPTVQVHIDVPCDDAADITTATAVAIANRALAIATVATHAFAVTVTYHAHAHVDDATARAHLATLRDHLRSGAGRFAFASFAVVLDARDLCERPVLDDEDATDGVTWTLRCAWSSDG